MGLDALQHALDVDLRPDMVSAEAVQLGKLQASARLAARIGQRIGHRESCLALLSRGGVVTHSHCDIGQICGEVHLADPHALAPAQLETLLDIIAGCRIVIAGQCDRAEPVAGQILRVSQKLSRTAIALIRLRHHCGLFEQSSGLVRLPESPQCLSFNEVAARLPFVSLACSSQYDRRFRRRKSLLVEAALDT